MEHVGTMLGFGRRGSWVLPGPVPLFGSGKVGTFAVVVLDVRTLETLETLAKETSYHFQKWCFGHMAGTNLEALSRPQTSLQHCW